MSRIITFEWNGKKVSQKIEGELELSHITPHEASEALLRAVGQYAYYGTMKADAKKLQQKIEAAFEFWQSTKYSLIDADENYTKKTESWKKSHIIAFNQREWKEHKAKSIKINNIVDKLRVICDSFEFQIRALQSVMSTMRTELEMIAIQEGHPVRGRGRVAQ